MNGFVADPPVDSAAAFQRAVRSAFREAADVGSREIWLCDPDFAAWPLGERAVVADLTRWVGAHRRLRLCAARYDSVARRHPRWVQWRRDWAHAVECRSPSDSDSGALPTLVLVPGRLALEVFDPVAFRGRVSREPADAVHLRERLEALFQQSTDAFPAHVTGL